MTFKVGDFVYIADHRWAESKPAKIIYINHGAFRYNVLVEFPDPDPGLHDGNGGPASGRNGCCYWTRECFLKAANVFAKQYLLAF
jgi:hypothetical protein